MRQLIKTQPILLAHLFITLICLSFFTYNLSYIDLTLMSDPWLYVTLLFEGEDPKIFGKEQVLFYYYALPIAFFAVVDLLQIPLEYRTGTWFFFIFNFGFFVFHKLLTTIQNISSVDRVSDWKLVALSLVGTFNFFTFSDVESGYALLHYFGVVFFCYAFINFLKSWTLNSLNARTAFILILASQFITTQITYYAIAILSAFILGLIFFNFEKSLKTMFVAMLSNSWFVYLILMSSNQNAAFADYFVQAEDFHFYSIYALPHLVAQLSGNWANVSGATHWGASMSSVPMSSVLLLIPFFVFLSVCYHNFDADDERVKKLSFVVALFWLATLSANMFSPVGYIIQILGDLLWPLLIFRNTNKFFTIVIVFLLIALVARGNRWQISALLFYSVFCVSVFLALGAVSPSLKVKEVPSYWQAVQEYVSKKSSPTYLLTPFTANTYYYWGAYNGYRYGLPFTPTGTVLYKTLAHPNNALIERIEKASSTDNFCEELQNLNITHIIHRSDVVASDHIDLSRYDCVQMEEEFFPIIIYQIDS